MMTPTVRECVRRLPVATVAVILGLSSALLAQAPPPLVVETDPLPPDVQRTKFHLPPGFEIQLVASEPDIGQPMNMNFDAHGRLWVTSSVEYPYPVAGEGVEPREEKWGKNEQRAARDWVTVLSGIDDTGKPAQVTRFAEGLNIPIGIIPDGDGAIIYSIPNVERFRDTDGDGKADERTKLFGPFGNVDTHGMAASFTRGLDGWIYATHGFRNTTKIQGTDGHVVEMNSGNTFRFKPDGSRVEHWTHGQVNPFGLCFDPWGNLYSADCHSMPLTCLLRGAYYQSFGKPHDGLGFGPDMIDHNHGSTGICGCAWYEAEQFPAEYGGCIFLCNPVTGRVHRDRIDFRGSSPWAVTQPDFITCDDGWFRPVDVKLGPDGALYIADFHNAVIGHYEVPLDHPRRDRTTGRIWRVVYRGESNVEGRVSSADGASPTTPQSPATAVAGFAPAQFDLTNLSYDQLIDRLGDINIATRNLAVDEIVRRFPREIKALKLYEAIYDIYTADLTPAAERRGAAWCWVLARSDRQPLLDYTLTLVKSELVVTHLIRAMATQKTQSFLAAVFILNQIPEPPTHASRAFFESFSNRPKSMWEHVIKGGEFNSVTARNFSKTGDLFLDHTQLMAQRELLSVPQVAASALKDPLPWVTAATGTRSPAGAAILMAALDEPSIAASRSDVLTHIARYGDDAQVGQLTSKVSSVDGENWRSQLADLHAVHRGLMERGNHDVGGLHEWGTRLVNELLKTSSALQLGWTPVAYGPNAKPASAFATQTRPFADGQQGALLHSSFPPGETGTGILRSDAFELPAKLSFFIAGHNGLPSQPVTARNLVRLCEAASGRVLREALPPRNDTAQFFEWDLTPHERRSGYIEIVDGDDRTAYAWLAVGRFSVEGLNPAAESPQLEGCKLVAELKLIELAPRLAELVRSAETPASLRGAAAGSLLALRPDARLAVLKEAAVSAGTSPGLREACYAAIVDDAASIGAGDAQAGGLRHVADAASIGGDAGSIPNVADAARVGGQADSLPHESDASRISHGALLKQVVQAAPAEAQRQLATLLAGDRDGAAALLDLVQQGAASPRLLQGAALVERLRTWSLDGFDDRLAKLTADLPAPDAALAELLTQRREHFRAAASPFDADRGKALFKQHCAACHQLGGEGAKIGPQLDGVGLRGPDRLFEDILDPNRNVDAAFRTSILVLTDGRSLSGLVRREEGATLVLANTEGKEFTVPLAEIEIRRDSPLSLMPAQVAEKLPPDELSQLVRYLLQQSKPAAATP